MDALIGVPLLSELSRISFDLTPSIGTQSSRTIAMDFASQLQNLEKRAANAASSSDRRRPRSPGKDDHLHGSGAVHGGRDNFPPSQRQRHNYTSQSHRHNQTMHHASSPLDAMKRFGYRVTPTTEGFRPKDAMERKTPHICLLSLSISDLPFEQIWKAWAETVSSSCSCFVSLVGHAKYPDKVQSPWLQQRLLLEPPRRGRGTTLQDPVFLTHRPKWGSVEITRAMRDCLQTALSIGVTNHFNEQDPRFHPNRFVFATPNKDGMTYNEGTTVSPPPVDKFIFISESCLPVRTLKECCDVLFPMNDDNADTTSSNAQNDSKTATTTNLDPWDISWLNARNRNTAGTPRNMYESDQFRKIHRMVPGMYRWKADQWILLSRKHALAILYLDEHIASSRDEFWNAFTNVSASDEMYFPTVLSILGYLCDDQNSHPQKESSGTATKKKDDSMEKVGDESAIPPSEASPPSASEILKRRVTYTDWSEGMRNPTSFSGLREFVKTATFARQQRCLFARKFVPKDKDTMSVEEWNQVLQELSTAEQVKKVQ